MGMLPREMIPSLGLARRSLDAFRGNETPTEEFKMPVWSVVMIGSTLVAFLLMDFLIEYTFSRLIPTLVMVESPQAILFEPLASEDPDTKSDLKGEVEPELLLVKQQPITSSFKSTIRHLRARAGCKSPFRGVGMHFVKTFVLHLQMNFLSIFLPRIFALPLATILCAPFSLAWTHIVISEPSPLPWYKRMPDITTIKKVIPATAIYALAREAVFFLPGYLALSYGLFQTDPSTMTPEQIRTMGLQTASVVILTAALAFLVLIPASVTLTRVQASLLAENEESIVPFDRTFGGRVSEDGVLGALDAWKTFDWNSRVRLLKAYVKAAAMEIAVITLFATFLCAQLMLVLGTEHKTVIVGKDCHGKPIQFDM
ncbi:hypothetical protein SS1G_02995 [Sclerotinia sclerotiorum 1980 UF-70]|uniref:Ubiquitin carrier protein n=2 Tax=Sclerotinia sclerotiorum (strain ATCC 18683 / 1980 / Ss-1) TaxID=665079 RepID=A7ECF6_SCLS1|nr:hypothetical protein SS1G_02995 [Sclerotinia sclerotiorum 1980 UF-70]APA09103.1 hypothetical protein sscle_04g038730 [Sclerotinia sclerotiorum 1980 UF-70]EDO00135.1 hypothetical protein SS1G_02995 [Sclerotinia sclerotiorum 1980 UF-70]